MARLLSKKKHGGFVLELITWVRKRGDMSSALWKFSQMSVRIGFFLQWKDVSSWYKVGFNEKLKLCRGIVTRLWNHDVSTVIMHDFFKFF